MSEHYLRRQATNHRRQSTTLPVFLRDQEEIDNSRRLSASINVQRRLSTVSQLYLPHGTEYHPQDHVPPTGPEAQQAFLFTGTTNDQTRIDGGRLSLISTTESYQPIDDDQGKGKKTRRRTLFVLEPLLSGLILFPILVLFWECGWNLVLILLNELNGFNSTLHLDEMSEVDFESYTWQSLFFPYLIVQFLLAFYYLGQELVYQFLRKQHPIVQFLLLKFHILGLATIYIFQWEMLWTIWDQFTPSEDYFELTVSILSLFALIVFIGHLSDIVCSPFVFSYDSMEYCIHFGCPLLTRDMKQWQINLINCILYEIIIANLSVMAWRGFYHFLDDNLYKDDMEKSAGLCLCIGYVLYFPLMYFQTYLEELNLRYDFWTFVSINFPQFYRNIRHLLAFLSCVFVWRGYWLLYDAYVDIFEDYYKTYLLLYLLTFLFLSILQTSSSTNGPLSHMEDPNQFFPLYPHCYVSTVHNKLSSLPFFQSKRQEQEEKQDTKL